jgi:hypothetical protein
MCNTRGLPVTPSLVVQLYLRTPDGSDSKHEYSVKFKVQSSQ